jgi:ring-1,2-phenylacetyl-CoA epoxidase subunit PaaB
MSTNHHDSQWPRYEVFKQDRPGRPHQNVGSVHAPDAELALQNARDVFARRPSCHSLWVVPAEVIEEWGSGGAEEQRGGGDWETKRLEIERLEIERLRPETQSEGLETEETNGRSAVAGQRSYALFAKQSQRQGMTYVDYIGDVDAHSASDALQQAETVYPDVPAIVWWVCPMDAIMKSQEEDVKSMFNPANDKRFRMPNEYRTVVKMHQIKRSEQTHMDGTHYDESQS